jgi:hypothetical protein
MYSLQVVARAAPVFDLILIPQQWRLATVGSPCGPSSPMLCSFYRVVNVIKNIAQKLRRKIVFSKTLTLP